MKKICGFLIIVFLTILPMNAAAKDNSGIKSGYTEDGIYYEIYYEVYEDGMVLYADGVEHVTVQLTYDSIIVPQTTIYWTEKIDGYLYAGNLDLLSYTYQANKTVATYYGSLYRQ